ncbi:MAG TPA: polysaccharide biosynthesis tyrosine autokinase [Holophagaceae bacterium]|nr:polysaccharide biosynthesis tyrosine autokinase [Holophagaceae bacterium]
MSAHLPTDPQVPAHRPAPGAPEPQEMDLVEWLGNLWDGRRTIALALGISIVVGGIYTWKATPVYQVEALLQIQTKKASASDPALTKMESFFSEPVEAQAEVEILRSALVLGRTVDALKLDLSASPKLLPVIGAALVRGKADAPRAEVDQFEVPSRYRGQKFRLEALADGSFRWESPEGTFLERGRPGELLAATYKGETLSLKMKSLRGKPGQVFILVRKPLQDAINDLRLALDVAERGKLTNVLGLTYKSSDPDRAAAVLNEVVDQYVRHKIERKGDEAGRAMALLQEKMPILKAQVEAAENKLNQFRTATGSVDLSREADLYLQQIASLNGQLSSLRQKKEELLRTYKESSDVVGTVNQQIAKLQGEVATMDGRMRVLPRNQQEVVRLSRDVQVSTELYTALLNNIQQLQVASAAELGNVVVVDRAAANYDAIAPKKSSLMLLFVFLGALTGAGLVLLKRSLRQGLEDHRLIESKLGLPVLVTIPHSAAQEDHAQAMAQEQGGAHLLAAMDPNDLAMESLRSLRTLLHFSLKDARNGVIMVTGPSPLIGKSFISANLAIVLAQSGAKVLLVDADLRRGNLYQYFGLQNRLEGLSEVLSGRMEWTEAVHRTDVSTLSVMKSGVIPPNPSELLMNPRLATFLAEAGKAYDYILVDAPPVLPVTDATLIGSVTGTVLLVARFGKNTLDELRTTQRRLENHGIPVRGCIFNDIAMSGFGASANYKYAYHYEYKHQ